VDWWNDLNITAWIFAPDQHGNDKYFIDFASDFHIEYVLWMKLVARFDDLLSERDGVNLREIVDYGKKKNVRVLLWVLWKALDTKLDASLAKFEKLGVAALKSIFCSATTNG